jgi:hypothetical protein
MDKLIKAVVSFAFSWAVSITAFSQEFPNQNFVMPDHTGRPAMVKGEFEEWSRPISVYSDSEVELFVSDITTPGWIRWSQAQFRQKGIYHVEVYWYYKNDHYCRREIIPASHKTDSKWLRACGGLRYEQQPLAVNTRKNTIDVELAKLIEENGLWLPVCPGGAKTCGVFSSATIPLSSTSLPYPITRAIARISTIVAREIGTY